MLTRILKYTRFISRRLFGSGKTHSDTGSIIIFAPVVALFTITLSALLLDMNYIYVAQSELQNRVELAATAAANHLDESSYYLNSAIFIDPVLSRSIAISTLSGFNGHGYKINKLNVQVSTNQICIDASAELELPAFGAILGNLNNWSVNARSIANLISGAQSNTYSSNIWC